MDRSAYLFIKPRITSLRHDDMNFYSRDGTVGETRFKGHPITVHECPEGVYRYGSTLSLTSKLNRRGYSMPRPGRFTPAKEEIPTV